MPKFTTVFNGAFPLLSVLRPTAASLVARFFLLNERHHLHLHTIEKALQC